MFLQLFTLVTHDLGKTTVFTSKKFSSHSSENSPQVSVRVGRDFTGDEGTYGTLDGDVTRVKISFTGDSASLQNNRSSTINDESHHD